MIELENITKMYNNRVILNNLNYVFKDKGLYLLKGKSGCGKTTLLKIIANRIKFQGIVNKDKDVFYLSFNNYLIEQFKVRENIEIHKDLFKEFKAIKSRLKIDKLLDKKVSKLSLGEKQRVGLFLALSSGCKIILLDEIFSGVDSLNRKIFLKEIKKASKNKLIIVTSHQDFQGYDYLLHLNEGKIEEEYLRIKVINKEEKRELKKCYKWGMFLHYKQFFHRFIFIISLIGIVGFYNNISKEVNEVSREFRESFSNNKLYYKNNDAKLNRVSFYDDIISKLPYQIYNYSYSYYSEGMSKVEVSSKDIYLGNGNLFSNPIYIEGLKENEIVLKLDFNKLCVNNKYDYSSFNTIKELLVGEVLTYEYNNEKISYLIKDVIFDQNDGVYLTYVDELLINMERIHKNDRSLHKYYLFIYNEQLKSFYHRINNVDSLLKYNFTYLDRDDKYSYFLVSESEYTYFNEEELTRDDLVCSDIGYSCSSLEFSKFISLYYINEYDLKDKIKYQRYHNDLEFDEIVISSSLYDLIKRKDKVNLKFYFDESFYSLDNVRIVDVIDEKELKIYHSKYDYLLFKEKFNKNIRINYIYSENDLNYKKRNSLYYEYINETKLMIEKLLNIIRVVIMIFILLMIFIIFFIEESKLKKYYKVFSFLNDNKEDYIKVYNVYILGYILMGLICLSNIFVFISYYFTLMCFYFRIKGKIKSRVTLD